MSVIPMNRSQRRQMKRNHDKELAKYKDQSKWINSLNHNQIEVIERMMRDLKKNTELECIADIDKVLTGTLLERMDMTWDESYEFNVQFGKFYAEYKIAVAEFGREERLKMLVELENEIVDITERWIYEGKTKIEIIKQLKEKYKGVGITTPEINNVYGRTLSNYKKHIEEFKGKIQSEIKKQFDDDKKSEYILEKLKKEYTRIGEKELNELIAAVKEEYMKPVMEPVLDKPKKKGRKKKEELKKEVNKMGLKVVNEVVKVIRRELEGEFGKYLIDENGVTIDDKNFKDLEALEKYKIAELERFNREIDEIKAVFEYSE